MLTMMAPALIQTKRLEMTQTRRDGPGRGDLAGERLVVVTAATAAAEDFVRLLDVGETLLGAVLAAGLRVVERGEALVCPFDLVLLALRGNCRIAQ